jgi:hypothetical protein
MLGAWVSTAATIILNASDGFGASSFSSGLNWAGGVAPSSRNDYVVNSGRRLRTAAVADPTVAFGGASLTIANGFTTLNMNGGDSSDLYGFTYKSTGATGVHTVNNLILNAGAINHLNGGGDVFRLAGAISVIGDSAIRAKQGPIVISSSISGSADLYIGASDGGGARTVTFSGNNSFTGDIITTAASALFVLGDTGSLTFGIGANGVSNVVSGSGSATFNGAFNIDTSGADLTLGNSWNLVTASTKVFGGTFSVAGYSDLGGGQWSNGILTFDTATGALSVVPEPGSAAALAGAAVLGFVSLRRRRRG